MLQRLSAKFVQTVVRHSEKARDCAARELLSTELTPATVLRGYLSGHFPMLTDGQIEWRSPDVRAIIPVKDFHLSKNLRRLMRQQKFEIRVNSDFDQVINSCSDREETWITPEIKATYAELFSLGFVKTSEAWLDGEMVGGAYGISIGRFFAGESQFSRVNDAGKVAFATLLEILKAGEYLLHDAQHLTPHLEKFGALEVSRSDFEASLIQAAAVPGRFDLPLETSDSLPATTIHKSNEPVPSRSTI